MEYTDSPAASQLKYSATKHRYHQKHFASNTQSAYIEEKMIKYEINTITCHRRIFKTYFIFIYLVFTFLNHPFPSETLGSA